MKHFVVLGLTVLISSSAHAYYRSYCVAGDERGRWAVSYNHRPSAAALAEDWDGAWESSLKKACAAAKRLAKAFTDYPVITTNSGYYSDRHYSVTVRCQGVRGSMFYTGSQKTPFEEAIHWAKNSGGDSCRFETDAEYASLHTQPFYQAEAGDESGDLPVTDGAVF